MKIEKAHWNLGEDDTLRITMPLQKIDKQRRIVSGFATLDNEDKHGDVVTKEASDQAFKEFLGNLRLMHQPIPAGRVLKFREEEFFDKETQKVYNGVYVDAYVSEGAENVWKMVLDGTLTGFSIGGDKVEAETRLNKATGQPARYVTKYRMNELSLVDNPANQFSNILSIQKMADGEVIAKGTLADVKVENVFYCKVEHDPVTLIGEEEEKDCLDCGHAMKNIGWFESDGGDKTEKVTAIINKFEADNTEGGDDVAKDKDKAEGSVETGVDANTDVESVEEVSPKGDDEVVAPEGKESESATNVEDENVSVTGTGEKQVEEAKEVVSPEFEDGKTVPGGEEITKLLDDLKKSLDDNSSKVSDAITKVTTDMGVKFGELAEKHLELTKSFGELSEKLATVENRLEEVGKTGALKKSADLGGSEEGNSLKKSQEKSFWNGAIFSAGSLND
jgi:hypothetical protein